MATYRIVNMYRKSKAVKGIHYDSWNEQIIAYRVDKRHSLLFGLSIIGIMAHVTFVQNICFIRLIKPMMLY